jgi:hypothetical protein
VQRPLASGPREWPASPTFQPLTDWLHGHALQEAVTRNPKLEVGLGSRPTMWLGQPANTWCVTDLIKSVTPLWTPINITVPMEFKTPHSTCSFPLVKVPV